MLGAEVITRLWACVQSRKNNTYSWASSGFLPFVPCRLLVPCVTSLQNPNPRLVVIRDSAITTDFAMKSVSPASSRSHTSGEEEVDTEAVERAIKEAVAEGGGPKADAAPVEGKLGWDETPQ